MAWGNKPGKGLVGVTSLARAMHVGPAEIVAIAEHELDRQILSCGMATAAGASSEGEKLRAWLKANPLAKAAKAGN